MVYALGIALHLDQRFQAVNITTGEAVSKLLWLLIRVPRGLVPVRLLFTLFNCYATGREISFHSYAGDTQLCLTVRRSNIGYRNPILTKLDRCVCR